MPGCRVLVLVVMLVALCTIAIALFVTMLWENSYGHVWALEFSPDGRQLMAAYNNESVRVWGMDRDDREVLRFQVSSDASHATPPSTIQFVGPRIVAAFRRNREKGMPDGYGLWDTTSGSRLRVVELPYSTGLFQVSDEGGLVLASSKDAPSTLDLFDLESGELVRALEGSASVAGGLRNQAAISPGGSRVVASFYARGEGDRLKVWDTGSGMCVKSFPVDSKYGLQISHDGKIFVDNGRGVWDLDQGAKIAEIERGETGYGEARLSSDGRRLALSSFYTGRVTVWDTREGHLIARINAAYFQDANRRTHVAFSPDGRKLATATGRTVKTWDTKGFQLIRVLDRGYRLAGSLLGSLAFIIWSMIAGVLWRRWELPQADGRVPRIGLPAGILLGCVGAIAIVNSAFGILNPGLCSCCTPTVLLLVMDWGL